MKTICAWCGVLLIPGDPAEVSHGVCKVCGGCLLSRQMAQCQDCARRKAAA